MRIFGIISFLVFATFPAFLLAQGGAGTTGVIEATIANQVDQAAGFVGAGRPAAFVGTDEIYNRTSSAVRTAGSTRAVTTTARARTTTTAAQRQAGAASRITTASGSLAGQTIPSAASLDFDLVAHPSMQRPLPVIETGLSRIQGIQDAEISFETSPIGTTVVITGTVASDRERKVTELILLFEPGINRVENLLQIR